MGGNTFEEVFSVGGRLVIRIDLSRLECKLRSLLRFIGFPMPKILVGWADLSMLLESRTSSSFCAVLS